MPKKKVAPPDTGSYKGVRDFYPEDMFIEKYIFDVMRKTSENFGYVEYSASVLEPAELYKAKSSEEILKEQTYTFKDRGDREVTLRPEMTPTVARMVAAKRRELSFPLRWYSIPNLFRYEQPQRGRLREHWQLNIDIFGVANERAEIEIVSVAYQLLKNFGAKDSDFEIRINDRNLINLFWDSLALSADKRKKLSKIIDKRDKIGNDVFESAIQEVAPKHAKKIVKALESGHSFLEALKKNEGQFDRLTKIIDGLEQLGVKNIIFDPGLMRGFEYYTGFVFEIYDTDPSNKRSLFGGGRYDNLLSIFGADPVPTVGFGAGDVTIRDFLETHKLLPPFVSPTRLYVHVMDGEFSFADIVSEKLRDMNVSVAIDYSERTVGDSIKKAVKDGIPYFLVIGKNESKNRTVTVKNLSARTEKNYPLDDKGLESLASAVK